MARVRLGQLFRHGSVYAVTSLVTGAMGVAVLPIYSRWLGREGIGTIEVLGAVASVVSFILSQGLSSAWFRLRFDFEGESRRRFETTGLWFLVGASLVGLAVMQLVGPALAQRLTPGMGYYPLWFVAVLGGCAGVFSELYAVRLQTEHKSSAYARFMLLKRVGVLALVTFLIVATDRGAAAKVAGETLGLVVLAVVAWWVMRPQPITKCSREMLVSIVAYSGSMLPHAVAIQAIGVTDRFVVGNTLGLAALGVYSMGHRIALVMETVNVGMGTAYRAIFTERVKRGEAAGVSTDEQAAARARDLEALARMGFSMVALGALVCQVMSAAAYDFLRIVAGAEFTLSWRVVPIVTAGLVAHAAYMVLAQPIVYSTSTVRKLPIVSGVGAAVNLMGCLLLVPSVGFLGAAWSRVGAYSVMAVGAFLVGRSILPIPYRWGRWWALFLVTALGAVAHSLIDLHVVDWPTRIGVKVAVLAATTLGVMRISELRLRSIAEMLPSIAK